MKLRSIQLKANEFNALNINASKKIVDERGNWECKHVAIRTQCWLNEFQGGVGYEELLIGWIGWMRGNRRLNKCCEINILSLIDNLPSSRLWNETLHYSTNQRYCVWGSMSSFANSPKAENIKKNISVIRSADINLTIIISSWGLFHTFSWFDTSFDTKYQ